MATSADGGAPPPLLVPVGSFWLGLWADHRGLIWARDTSQMNKSSTAQMQGAHGARFHIVRACSIVPRPNSRPTIFEDAFCLHALARPLLIDMIHFRPLLFRMCVETKHPRASLITSKSLARILRAREAQGSRTHGHPNQQPLVGINVLGYLLLYRRH